MKVALVEDRQMVRAGIRQMLTPFFDTEVYEVTERFPAALDQLLSLGPDVVLVGEVEGQDLSFVRWLGRYRETGRFRILLLKVVRTESEVSQLLEAGAHGYVPPTADERQLVSGVITVAGGGYIFLPGLGGPPPGTGTEAAPSAVGLTVRERSVLCSLGRGMSNAEIAKELCISEATVKKHLSQVLQKTRQPDRLRAGLYAYRHGMR